jgi:hypothetical protein
MERVSSVKRRCSDALETLQQLAEDGEINENALLQMSKKLKVVHDADAKREYKICRDVVIGYAIQVPHSIGNAPEEVDWFSATFVNLLVRKKRAHTKGLREKDLEGQDLADAIACESAKIDSWVADLIDFFVGDGHCFGMVQDALEMLMEADEELFEGPIKFHLENEVKYDACDIYADSPSMLDWLLELAPSLADWAASRRTRDDAGVGGGACSLQTESKK